MIIGTMPAFEFQICNRQDSDLIITSGGPLELPPDGDHTSSKRIILQNIAFTDRTWTTHFLSQSDTVMNANQYVGHISEPSSSNVNPQLQEEQVTRAAGKSVSCEGSH